MIIIKLPVADLTLQDLYATLDSMRRPDDQPITTGGGGFAVGEGLAHRFLSALVAGQAAAPTPDPDVDVTVWDAANPDPPVSGPEPEPTPKPKRSTRTRRTT